MSKMSDFDKKFVDMLCPAVHIGYHDDDKIVSSFFEMIKEIPDTMCYFEKQDVEKFAKHMKTRMLNREDNKLLQNKNNSNIYFAIRDEFIKQSQTITEDEVFVIRYDTETEKIQMWRNDKQEILNLLKQHQEKVKCYIMEQQNKHLSNLTEEEKQKYMEIAEKIGTKLFEEQGYEINDDFIGKNIKF